MIDNTPDNKKAAESCFFYGVKMLLNLLAYSILVYVRELDKWLLCGVSAFF